MNRRKSCENNLFWRYWTFDIREHNASVAEGYRYKTLDKTKRSRDSPIDRKEQFYLADILNLILLGSVFSTFFTKLIPVAGHLLHFVSFCFLDSSGLLLPWLNRLHLMNRLHQSEVINTWKSYIRVTQQKPRLRWINIWEWLNTNISLLERPKNLTVSRSRIRFVNGDANFFHRSSL